MEENKLTKSSRLSKSPTKKSTKRTPKKVTGGAKKGSPGKRKTKVFRGEEGVKYASGEKAAKAAQMYKKSNNLHIPRAQIYRIIKEKIGDDRIRADAVDEIHKAVERKIEKLYRHALTLAEFERRKTNASTPTILEKDFIVIAKLAEQGCCQ